ncbi:carboxyl transferase domain-containing protein [Pseudomonas sp. dw_358]|uniref:acyl-CoA carboxylase subunit beta n=1 Tax=Pseudomonas sp. dw_358 TaxID=2720083 RepID=UPI001BD2A99B|nr:carboxyl transferase domain-containing protein [Pseudomonas sp. dw_358]
MNKPVSLTPSAPPAASTMADLIAEHSTWTQKALSMGGEERIAKQHALGKLTVRERIDYLLDPGSFQEYGRFTSHYTSDIPTVDTLTPADGVVMGFGLINGRHVCVVGEDFTVKGGSHGVINARKKLHAIQMARRERVPLIWLLDGAGARGQELMNDGLPDVTHFLEQARLSGVAPQIGLVLGPCAGDSALVAAGSEFVVMRKGNAMLAAGGPPVVKAATGIDVSKEDLGGSSIHTRISGVADNEVETDEAALALARDFLSYLPQNAWCWPERGPAKPPHAVDLDTIVPAQKRRAYDMKTLIRGVVDADSFLEIKPEYAKMILTGFARMDGHPVGVIANQPMVHAGAITAAAAKKAQHFVELCSAYHVPLVFLEDVPGVMTGPQAEKEGTLRAGLALVNALAWADVPKVTIVIRKAFGFAACAMAGWGGEQSYVGAWLTADFASLPVSGGVAAAFKREIEAAPDPVQAQREIEARFSGGTGPYNAAARFTVHDIIAPSETRGRILHALSLARCRRTAAPVPVAKYGVAP